MIVAGDREVEFKMENKAKRIRTIGCEVIKGNVVKSLGQTVSQCPR